MGAGPRGVVGGVVGDGNGAPASIKVARPAAGAGGGGGGGRGGGGGGGGGGGKPLCSQWRALCWIARALEP